MTTHSPADDVVGARADLVAATLARHARRTAHDDDTLVSAGLDSLAIVRVVLAVLGPDAEGEIDLGDIGTLRTIGELRAHLEALPEPGPAGVTGA